EPFFSHYQSTLSEGQRAAWRKVVDHLLREFQLKRVEVTSIPAFKRAYGDDWGVIMVDDRGPQITFEFVNGYSLSADQRAQVEARGVRADGATDLREPVMRRASELLEAAAIPVTPGLAGVFALDFFVRGVSKA